MLNAVIGGKHKDSLAPRKSGGIDETDSLHELDSLISGYLPSLIHTRSTVSSNELIEESGMLANRFAQALLKDNGFRALCEIAFQLLNSERFERNMRRLLDYYVVDLLQAAKQQIERSATRALKRHQNEVVEALNAILDPNRAMKEVAMRELANQRVEKLETLKSFLSGSALEVRNTEQEKPKNDDASESSDIEDNIALEFESVKPFLCIGAPFENLKANLESFLFPSQKTTTPSNTEPALNDDAAKIRKGNEVGVSSVWETTATLRVNRQTESAFPAGANQNLYLEQRDVVPSYSDLLKTLAERMFGRSLLWWPLKEPLRPLADGMHRFCWKCVSQPSQIYYLSIFSGEAMLKRALGLWSGHIFQCFFKS